MMDGMASLAGLHPLTPLTAEEIAKTVAIVRAGIERGAEAKFEMIELAEPEKSVVRAYAPGDPVARRAWANVYFVGQPGRGPLPRVADRGRAPLCNRAARCHPDDRAHRVPRGRERRQGRSALRGRLQAPRHRGYEPCLLRSLVRRQFRGGRGEGPPDQPRLRLGAQRGDGQPVRPSRRGAERHGRHQHRRGALGRRRRRCADPARRGELRPHLPERGARGPAADQRGAARGRQLQARGQLPDLARLERPHRFQCARGADAARRQHRRPAGPLPRLHRRDDGALWLARTAPIRARTCSISASTASAGW